MNSRTITAIAIGVVIIFIAYNSYVLFPKEKAYESVSPQEFYKLMQRDDVFVIDVHVPEQKHLTGTDVWIPYDRIEEMQDVLPKDKDTIILVYCRSGHMSKIAASKLAQMGYKIIYDLDGGIIAWQKAGLPI
jgi:rhodanese-related sulfurtransferase